MIASQGREGRQRKWQLRRLLNIELFLQIHAISGDHEGQFVHLLMISFQNGTQQGTWKDILTLMPGNVPKITNSFTDNMIGSHISMFAIQLQRQARGSICSTRALNQCQKWFVRNQRGTYKIKLSFQSCCPFFALRSEVSSVISSNSNLTL